MKKVGIHFAALVSAFMYSLPVLAEEAEGKKSLPQMDVASFPNLLFWMVVCFVALLVLMRFVGLPGIQKTLSKRQCILDADLTTARRASEEAQAVAQAYETDLHEARHNAQETVDSIVREAALESSAQCEKQHQEMAHRLTVAHENIARAKHLALEETPKFVNELVQDIVKKIMLSGVESDTSKVRK